MGEAARARTAHCRGKHVEHDLVGDQITAGLMGSYLPAESAASLSFGPQQPHLTARSAGMTISRFWILPVGPLGNASTIHTWRGYL
jgi:hypothetical protein